METALTHLSAAFRLLILKPIDILLFGGSGTIKVSRKVAHTNVRVAGLQKAQYRADEGMDEGTMIPKWLTTSLPTVYDDQNGESFFSI